MKKRKAAADIFKEQNVMLQHTPEPLEEEKEEIFSADNYIQDTSPSVPPPGASDSGLKSSEELQLEKEPIKVRETGYWWWRRIIIPPNVYVVHTRIGRDQPVTIGLGVSFRYNPYTDAYLVVPAAMQTIGVVANCITKEKQGINILAYVQWQIDDFAVAYRKLDFSDSRDPLGIVNAQLREQAEAAIKDKIATMSVEEVLTDKAPIIEELTARLKAVTEGRTLEVKVTDEGLGIKIVTVQIREALVSSQKLWQDLQAPFRHQQEKTARISHLDMQNEIWQKELKSRQTTETSEAETLVEIERIKQSKQTEALELKLTEQSIRFTKEQENEREKLQLEEQTTVIRRESDQRLETQSTQIEQERKLRALARENEEKIQAAQLAAEASNRQASLQTEQALHALAEENRLAISKLEAEQQRLAREETIKMQEVALNIQLQAQQDALAEQILEARLTRKQKEQVTDLAHERETQQLKLTLRESEAEIAQLEQAVRNSMSEAELVSQLIAKLPEIATQLPEVHDLKVVQTGGNENIFNSLPVFLAQMMAVAETMGLSGWRKEEGG
ncbi:SPFH domain-containing protein [Anaerolineales bacterium HSG24]|nr:SPFH domain-containing protein [Anaerolineales bacterium HSG24]